MRIAFLSAGNLVPSSRFRRHFYSMLSQRGHQCTIFASFPQKYDSFRALGWRLSQLLKRTVRRWHLLRIRYGNFDVVVLDRGLFHTSDYSFEVAMRKFTKRLVLEIDDPIFLTFPEKTAALASMADHVIAGNDGLATWLLPYNSQLSTIPFCVSLDEYVPKPAHLSNQPPVIGWIGSAGNVIMLAECAPALKRLAKEIPFRLRVISGLNHRLAEVDLRGVDVQWVDFRKCNEIVELHRMDIGIMPLPDGDAWMRCKCNAKMVQYLTVGLPAVGSAIGFNFELVDSGKNGFLAKDNQEWYESLKRLLTSPELRKQLGEAGRASMLERFTMQGRIDEFESILVGNCDPSLLFDGQRESRGIF